MTPLIMVGALVVSTLVNLAHQLLPWRWALPFLAVVIGIVATTFAAVQRDGLSDGESTAAGLMLMMVVIGVGLASVAASSIKQRRAQVRRPARPGRSRIRSSPSMN